LQNRTSSSIRNKAQDFKGCGLERIKVNFVMSGPEIKIAIYDGTENFLVVIFLSKVYISLPSSFLAIVYVLFQDIKPT